VLGANSSNIHALCDGLCEFVKESNKIVSLLPLLISVRPSSCNNSRNNEKNMFVKNGFVLSKFSLLILISLNI
jgi:hypothetical protein